MDRLKAREYLNIKIIRYEESIYYANVDNFKYKILKLSKLNPDMIVNNIKSDYEHEFKRVKKLHDKQVFIIYKSLRLV